MYARDRVKQYVPVTDIYEEIGPKASRQRRPFTPRNTRDFNPNVLYVIKTTVGNPKDDTKKHSYYGFIGRLDGEFVDGPRPWFDVAATWIKRSLKASFAY
jgi:hypothetical protein